jgi:hypothetical protein
VVTYPTEDGMIKQTMLFYCCLAHPTLIIRTKTWTHQYDTERIAHFPEDYDLWLRLSKSEMKFANIGSILVYLRKHSGNVSTVTKETEKARL